MRLVLIALYPSDLVEEKEGMLASLVPEVRWMEWSRKCNDRSGIVPVLYQPSAQKSQSGKSESCGRTLQLPVCHYLSQAAPKTT